MAGKQDLALTDNVADLNPETGLTEHFAKGTLFSELPAWLQERVADNPLLLRRVRVEMRPHLVDIDEADAGDD